MGRSVFALETAKSPNEGLGESTAFCVGPSLVMASSHALQDAETARIRTDQGKTFAVAGLLARSEESDLAVLLVDVPSDAWSPLVISSSVPTASQRVCTVGGPLDTGAGCVPSFGIVLEGSWEPSTFRLRSAAGPGWSGAPVLDERGEVLGVMRGELGRVALAVDASSARSLLDTASRSKPKPLAGVAASGLFGRPEPERFGRKSLPHHLRPIVDIALAGDFDRAATLLRDHLKEDGKDALAWQVLAVIEHRRGRTESVIEALKTSRDLQEEDVMAWLMLGGALAEAGRHREAIEALRGAVERDPINRDALYRLGYSCNELGLWDDAIDAWKKLLLIDSTHIAARQGINYAEVMRDRQWKEFRK